MFITNYLTPQQWSVETLYSQKLTMFLYMFRFNWSRFQLLCRQAKDCKLFNLVLFFLFYSLGFLVAENPFKTIAFALLSVLICCVGFLNFYQERDPLKLWVPEDSTFLKNTQFIIKNFGEGIRTQNVLIVAKDDVLTPEVMQKLAIINKEIKDIQVIGEKGEVIDLDKICFK